MIIQLKLQLLSRKQPGNQTQKYDIRWQRDDAWHFGSNIVNAGNKLIIIMSKQGQDQEAKIQNIILELNKTGLSYLKYTDYAQAIEYFKKAEKIVAQQLIISNQSPKINQLAAVTYNNIACYYKKTKKPKVALKYLQKSLQIEIYKLNDWISIGSTHLNICAIYSYLKKHEQAIGHVQLALQLLQKQKFQQNDTTNQGKAFWNIKMLCLYNKAIEQEHLKQYEPSLESYRQTKQLAKLHGAKNVAIIMSCDEAINRIQADFATRKKYMVNLILKKRDHQQSGHYQFMRRNINRTKRKNNMDTKDFSTAQLVRSGEYIKLLRIATPSNKQSMADLTKIRQSSQNPKYARQVYRVHTQHTSNL